MELTEENAHAGDRAYLNLVLLQTLGTDHTNLIWCSIWSLIIQSFLVGFLVSKIWSIIVLRRRYSKYHLGGILFGFGIIIIQFGISINQTYILSFQSSDYSTISIDQSKWNLSPLLSCGILSGLCLSYGTWLLYKLNTRKLIFIPFIISTIISLGLIIGISIITLQMPSATVSTLFLVKNWLRNQSILVRVWLGWNVLLSSGIWGILIYLIRSNKEYEKCDRNRKISGICQALCLPTLNLVILLIYSIAEVPSLANASKPLIQSLPPLFLFSLVILIETFECGEIEGNMKLPEFTSTSSIYYKSPPISGSKSTSSPPSAYTYGNNAKNRKSHSRLNSSPMPSPIPTPRYSNYSDVPLSIIAPFSEWLEQSTHLSFPSNHDDDDNHKNGIEDDMMSYKSAVPSGKTLLRTKSERSKKDKGIILDHTGWNEDLANVPIPTLNKLVIDKDNKV